MNNPTTGVQWGQYGFTAEATQRFGTTELRCQIEFDTWSDSSPNVSFARRRHRHDTIGDPDWSAFGTGSLHTPQTLREWLRMIEVFQLAYEAAIDEISSDSVSPDQIAVFDRRTGDPHPVFSVPHRPERQPLTRDDSG